MKIVTYHERDDKVNVLRENHDVVEEVFSDNVEFQIVESDFAAADEDEIKVTEEFVMKKDE